MKTHPHSTFDDRTLVNKFYAQQTPARRDSIWARLFGESTDLATIPQSEQASRKNLNRKLMGVKSIPVGQIAGTLGKNSDFDHQFRPLKSTLRDQWVKVYRALENGTWDPIVVHRVGEQYYVEDGHLHVSVARSLGKTLIEAVIWEYPVYEAQSGQCAERRATEAYAVCDTLG